MPSCSMPGRGPQVDLPVNLSMQVGFRYVELAEDMVEKGGDREEDAEHFEVH